MRNTFAFFVFRVAAFGQLPELIKRKPGFAGALLWRVFKIEPEYWEEARKAKWQGTATVLVVVNQFGEAKSLGLGLDEAAVDEARKWVFKPGRKDGHRWQYT